MHYSLNLAALVVNQHHLVDGSRHIELTKQCSPASLPPQTWTLYLASVELAEAIILGVGYHYSFTTYLVVLPFRDNNGIAVSNQNAWTIAFSTF